MVNKIKICYDITVIFLNNVHGIFSLFYDFDANFYKAPLEKFQIKVCAEISLLIIENVMIVLVDEFLRFSR